MTVPSDPNLIRQPGTLDERVEVPEDPARAMGHDEDRAREFRDAVEQHREQAERERDSEDVGPRKPGDHAGTSDDDSDDAEATTSTEDGEASATDPNPEPEPELGTTSTNPFSDDAGEAGTVYQSEVPDGTVEDVKSWVGDDPERARQALEAERAGQNRSTLVTYLEGI
jgi:hypothetical protein